MRVCSVKIINTNDMSMGPLNKHSPAGGHAKRISPNSIGQAKRPVLADYLPYAFSVRTTAADIYAVVHIEKPRLSRRYAAPPVCYGAHRRTISLSRHTEPPVCSCEAQTVEETRRGRCQASDGASFQLKRVNWYMLKQHIRRSINTVADGTPPAVASFSLVHVALTAAPAGGARERVQSKESGKQFSRLCQPFEP